MGTSPNKDLNRSDTLFLGIDGGGTKCRAIIVDQNDQLIGQGDGGPANPYHGVERTVESIVNSADAALRDAGLTAEDKDRLICGMGLAGVNLPSLFKVMNQWQHPFAELHLTHDLHIACIAAHGQSDGAVIVSGTGSCGFSHVNGKSLTLGAHGFLCGDKGSGAWFGLSAIKAVLLDFDGLGPETLLSSLVEEQLQSRGIMIVERLSGAKSSDYARLAPLVFYAAEQGDAVAIDLVKGGASYLTDVARKLWQTQPPRMAMLGGVSKVIVNWMDDDVAEKMSAALNPPEFGAIQFSRLQHQKLQARRA